MIVVRTSRTRLLLLFAGATLFVAGGFWLCTIPGVRWLVWPVGVASVLFFGLCGGVALRRLFGHRIALLIDRRGIVDNASAAPAGRIGWNEISRIGVAELSGQRFVGIDVHHPEKLLARIPRPRRKILETNPAFLGYLVNLPETILGRPAAEMVELLQEYLRDPRLRETLGEAEPLDPSGTAPLE